MLKIGITGKAGFIGTHLYNTLCQFSNKFECIPFEDLYFEDKTLLETFVSQCDVIVHLAAMNRHNDQQVLYQTNINLVKQVIDACEITNSLPHIIFSSSIQEEKDNFYGRSKKEGRQLFEKWAERNSARFSCFIISNVFGPFGNPYYNSVVATFCHQLTHNEQPKIDVDGELKLIYVGELVEVIMNTILQNTITRGISSGSPVEICYVPHTTSIKVSELLEKLKRFKQDYFEQGIIPSLDNEFDKNLFNTLLCYIDHNSFYPYCLKLNTDNRGTFVETIKLNSGGQVSFSTTVPNITRGNHYHTRKAERFAVLKGKAQINIRRIGSNKIHSFELDGTRPSFVDMPIWYTHNITNIGNEELITLFWISELFDKDDPDTFYEEV